MASPQQASDATEHDENRPIVTSIGFVISGGGARSTSYIIPTTNQTTWDNERRFREKLQTHGQGNYGDETHVNETAASESLNIHAQQTRPRIVRHPDRATMRQRLDTFTGWPHTNGQPPQRLAEAGLFNTDAQPNNTLCRVCHINDSCIQVMPCNHLCLCARCADRAHRCPVCGRNVEMSFRSYSASSSSAGNNDTS